MSEIAKSESSSPKITKNEKKNKKEKKPFSVADTPEVFILNDLKGEETGFAVSSSVPTYLYPKSYLRLTGMRFV